MPAVNAESRKHFAEQGYVVLEGLLSQELDIQPVVQEYQELLDRLVERSYSQGKLTSTYGDLPFAERLTRVMHESGEPYHMYMDISLPLGEIAADSPIHLGAGVFNLLTSPRLLDAVESFVGPEIYVNPVQHVRIKPPERVLDNQYRFSLAGSTPWHQDQGVVLEEADESDILTVWMAITDATLSNGCLMVVPGSHSGGLAPHCPVTKEGVRTTHIAEAFQRVEEAIPLPMKSGSVLFMHRRTMHASLPNASDGIRWSYDLRYNPVGQPSGRPGFPGFVARSRSHPEQEVHDYRVWAGLWLDAREALAGKAHPAYHRWQEDSPFCA
jgi:phytanoyl-CoA hydroxylase